MTLAGLSWKQITHSAWWYGAIRSECRKTKERSRAEGRRLPQKRHNEAQPIMVMGYSWINLEFYLATRGVAVVVPAAVEKL